MTVLLECLCTTKAPFNHIATKRFQHGNHLFSIKSSLCCLTEDPGSSPTMPFFKQQRPGNPKGAISAPGQSRSSSYFPASSLSGTGVPSCLHVTLQARTGYRLTPQSQKRLRSLPSEFSSQAIQEKFTDKFLHSDYHSVLPALFPSPLVFTPPNT